MAIQIKTKIPGPVSQALMVRREKSVARGPFHVTPVFVSKASGATLEDVDGNHFIDFSSGIGVMNTGHGQQVTKEAIQKQLERFTHTSFNVTPYESYVALCEKLNEKTPGAFTKKSFLVNSGAEAVENAIKIARAFTKRKKIICFEHGYHGRTYMAMALTSKVVPYKEGFGPFSGEVHRVPFPYSYRGVDSTQAFEAFKNVALQEVGLNDLAAVIIEPVLGEGGFVPAPQEFLIELQSFCSKNGVVLIADEIQTGFGRTGKLFASEQLGLEADLIVTAKGLGAGLPISAVTGRAEIMDAPIIGGIGGTYCGNPLACAAALSVFEIFEKTELLNHAQKIGESLRRGLMRLKENFEFVGDVRGLGPMQGMELVKNRTTKEAFPEAAKSLIRHSYENGLILMSAGSYGNVIRFLVPLVITDAEIEEGLSIIEKGLRAINESPEATHANAQP